MCVPNPMPNLNSTMAREVSTAGLIGPPLVPTATGMARRQERVPRLTTLEPRVLYSAVPFDVAAAEVVEPAELAAWHLLTSEDVATGGPRSLVLVDGGMAGADQLASAIAASRPGAGIVILDPQADGISELERLLGQYQDLERIELFSHGNQDGLSLGDRYFAFGDDQWLARLAGALNGALVAGGDLLLQGCDLAAGQSGQEALAWLAQNASIDVAASSDLTGSAVAGGDWTLEFTTGEVAFVTANGLEHWEGVLLTPTAATGSSLIEETTAVRDRGSHRAVAMHSDGSFVIVWAHDLNIGTGFGVHAQRFNALGQAQGGPIIVNQQLFGDQEWASVDMDASGRFVVTWTSDGQDGDQTGVYARLYSNTGVALGNEFRVNTQTNNQQENSTVAMADDGSFVIAWEGDGPGDSQGIFAQRYDSSGNALGGNVLVNTVTGSGQWDPAISINDSGAFVIVWDDNNGFHFQRFDVAGNAAGGPVAVTSSIGAGNGSVLLNNDGSIVATWRDSAGGPVESLFRIYGPANEILLGPTVIATVTTTDQSNPSVTGSGNGSFSISWDGSNPADDAGVLVRQFLADGTPIGTEILANSHTAGFQGFSSLAVNDAGGLVVVWSGESATDAAGVYFARGGAPTGTDATLAATEDTHRVLALADFGYSDPDGDPFANVRILAVPTGTLLLDGERIETSVLVTAGKIAAGRLVYLAPANASGLLSPAIEFTVSDGTYESTAVNRLSFNVAAVADQASVAWGDTHGVLLPGTTVNSTLPGEQTGQHVAALTGGGFVVVWQSTDGYLADGDDGTKVFLQRYDADGQRLGIEIQVEPGSAIDQFRPRIAGLDDGGFVVVWETNSPSENIYAQRFDAAGNLVNRDGSNGGTPGPFRICLNQTGTQTEADVIRVAGGFVAAWASSDPVIVSGTALGVVARFFGLDGSVSDEVQVNTFDTGPQRFARLAELANGRVLVTWVNQNGDSFDVQGRIIDPYAITAGPEFTINNRTALRQLQQSVASLGDQGFVVTWQSEDGDGDAWGIMARRFDLNGNPLDADDLAVNQLTTGPQQSPKVIGKADGSFTVFWHTWGVDADGQGIASRRFIPSLNSFGTETAVNTPAAGHQTGAEAALLANGRIATVWESVNRHGAAPEFGRDVVLSLLQDAFAATEDAAIPLQLSIGQIDSSESITNVLLSGLPAGAILSDGTNTHTASGSGFVDITSWNLSSLAVTLPIHCRDPLELQLQVELTDGGSQRTTQTSLVLNVAGVNDLLTQPGSTASTASHQTVNLAPTTVVNPANDPDHASATPPAVSPLLEYVVDPNAPPATNMGGQLEWQPLGAGPAVLLPGATAFGTASSTAIGDIDATLSLSSGIAGTLDLSGLSGNQTAIELWIRPVDLLQTGLIFEWGSATQGFAIYQTQGTVRVAIALNQTVMGFALPNLELVAGGLRAGEFNQIVLVLDGPGTGLGNTAIGDVALYINGQLADTIVDAAGLDQLTASSILASGGAAELVAGVGGANGTAASTFLTAAAPAFTGQLARLAIFDQVLDAEEVQNRFIAIENSADVVSIAGTAVSGPATVTLPSGALLAWLPDGSFNYDPNGQFDYLPLGQTAIDTFTYEVADQSGAASTVTVTVTITKTINTAPDAINDSFATSENVVRNGSVAGNDQDIDLQAMAWSLVAGPTSGNLSFQPDGTFSFDPGTDFDYLKPGQSATANFTYRVTDSLGASDTAVVTITVNGTNDQPVLVTNAGLTVNEGATGTVLTPALLSGFDVDDGAAELQFRVTGLPANGTVRLNGIALAVNGTFTQQDLQLGRVTYDHDGSETTSDSVSLQLADGGENGTSPVQLVFAITVVPVSDQAVGPVFDLNPATNAVSENAAAGTHVGIRAGAVDGDPGDVINWSLDNDSGGQFTINASTGIVSVAAGASGLDRESGPTRTIVIRATSSDGTFSTRGFTIALNDLDEFDVSAPVDVNAAVNAVDENAASGTLTGITASASDADATNSTVTWSLTDSAGGRFAIDAATGVVRVADGTLLNLEAAAAHTITVRATSADGSTADSTFAIALNDVDEFDVTVPVDGNAAGNTIDENAAAGAAVGITAVAADADGTTNAVSWSLDDDGGGRFVIDPQTGVVTVATGGPGLNAESALAHAIVIRATSADGSFSTASFSIAVTDLDEFEVSAISDLNAAAQQVPENAAAGTLAGLTAFASDADATNNTVSWSLVDDAGGRFAIDPLTGVVTVAGPLDFELSDGHQVTVRAMSADGSSSVRSFKVLVLDVADAPPPPPRSDTTPPVTPPSGGSSGSTGGDPAPESPVTGPVEGPPPSSGSDEELLIGGSPAGGGAAGAAADTVNRNGDFAGNDNEKSNLAARDAATGPGGTAAAARSIALDFQLRTTTSRKIAGLTEYGSGDSHDWFARFMRALDDHREGVLEIKLENQDIVSTAAGLIAVGYLTWIVKGSGALLSAFVSSLPAWQAFDPLLVIEASGQSDEDDESIEDMVDHDSGEGN